MPPSAEMVSPVTNREASEARNTITSAMSSGVAQRRSGVWASTASMTPGTALFFSHRAVSTTPGATALTLIPAGPSSMARDLVAASMAPLGGRVSGPAGRADQPRHRGEVDDRAPTVLGHR